MRIHITVTDDNGNTYEGTTDLAKTNIAKTKSAKKSIAPAKGRPKKAPQVIHDLYLQEYFKEPKPLDEVVKKLAQMRYNMNRHTIEMALERAKYLTNTGNRTYIEKYPPS